MTNFDIIDANEAKSRSDEVRDRHTAEYFEKIFKEGILPTIEKGEYKCSIQFFDNKRTISGMVGPKDCPENVLKKLRNLGYKVEYGSSCYDQRDGYQTDKSKLEISWL